MKTLRYLIMAAVLSFGMVVAIGSAAWAQEDPATEWRSYPVSIHQGTCDQPTEQPAYDLDVTRAPGDEGDGEGGDMRGAVPGTYVTTIDQTIDIAFNDLLDGPAHVIAVHESPEAYGTIVACGEIGGPEDNGRVVVGLRPVGDGGVTGIAILDEDDAGFLGLGDDEVNVRVYVFQLDDMAVTAATPVPADQNGVATPVPTDDSDTIDDAPEEDVIVDDAVATPANDA